MSGQLVGEVIAAADWLRSRGVTERGFMALIAIAEKAPHETRQASVRWDHLRNGLFGASKRTAERAVRDLRVAGVVELVRPGFNNNQGRSCAPVYLIRPLTDTDTTVSYSGAGDTDTAVSYSGATDTDKPGTDTDKPGGRYRHLGVVLDGHIDGSIDGTTKESGASAAKPARAEPENNPGHLAPIPAAVTTKPARKKPAKPRTPIPEDFTVPDHEIVAIVARFPAATRESIDRETFKFVNHFQSTGQSRPGWLASWRNWMARADERGDFTNRTPARLSTADQRVRDIQALKHDPARLELEQ